MIRILPILIFFLSPLSLFAMSAVVIESHGASTVLFPKGVSEAARLGMELPKETRLQTKKGGSVTLLQMDGALLRFREGTEYQVGKKEGKEKNQNQKIFLPAWREVERITGNGPTPSGVQKMFPPRYGKLRILPLMGGIEGVYPRETALLFKNNLHFEWRASVLSGKNLRIVLFQSGREHVGFPISVTDRKKTISTQKMGIKKNEEYYWYIGEEVGSGKYVGKSQRFSFSVLSRTQEVQLQKELQEIQSVGLSTKEGANFLTALVYYRFRMFSEMAAHLEPLYQKYKTPALQRLLFLSYIKMGRIKEAKRYEFSGRGS